VFIRALYELRLSDFLTTLRCKSAECSDKMSQLPWRAADILSLRATVAPIVFLQKL
jgi:hypothetical protein